MRVSSSGLNFFRDQYYWWFSDCLTRMFSSWEVTQNRFIKKEPLNARTSYLSQNLAVGADLTRTLFDINKFQQLSPDHRNLKGTFRNEVTAGPKTQNHVAERSEKQLASCGWQATWLIMFGWVWPQSFPGLPYIYGMYAALLGRTPGRSMVDGQNMFFLLLYNRHFYAVLAGENT